jgi:uncharacterized protein
MIKYLLFLIVFLLSFEVYSQSNETSSYIFPKPIGVVNDFENDFTATQIKELTVIINNHEKLTTNQIVIVTVPSYDSYKTLFWYSLDMFNYWGVGQRHVNNGVMLIFSLNKRDVRIQVGYGLEQKLEDHEAKYIIDKIFIPKIKENEVYNGVLLSLEAIIAEIE